MSNTELGLLFPIITLCVSTAQDQKILTNPKRGSLIRTIATKITALTLRTAQCAGPWLRAQHVFNHSVLIPILASRFYYSHIIDQDPEAQVMGGGLVTCIKSQNDIRLCNSDLFSSICLLPFKKQLKLCCMRLILYLDLLSLTIIS